MGAHNCFYKGRIKAHLTHRGLKFSFICLHLFLAIYCCVTLTAEALLLKATASLPIERSCFTSHAVSLQMKVIKLGYLAFFTRYYWFIAYQTQMMDAYQRIWPIRLFRCNHLIIHPKNSSQVGRALHKLLASEQHPLKPHRLSRALRVVGPIMW